uniref:Uncharacterized protein n=1 Tax=Anguilla anguilla TaxID=7936 RepID=A0A0E9S4K2_ANGAN
MHRISSLLVQLTKNYFDFYLFFAI